MLISGMRSRPNSWTLALWSAIGSLPLCGTFASAAASVTADSEPHAEPRKEVTVTAKREIDRSTLEHVIVPHFVESHGAAGERIDQVGRWRADVCPETIGLQGLYNEFVSRRVVEVARSVGAPTKRAGRCATNVDIIFTRHPQELLNSITRNNRALLGYSVHWKELSQFRHTIQAWYVTGTRSSATVPNGNAGPSSARPAANGGDMASGGATSSAWAMSAALTASGGLQVDDPDNLVWGQAGSLLGHGVTSEFMRVTVIADANALSKYPLRTMADYIAMLALTRTALGGCNPLPSIIDLLSEDCGTRARSDVMTEADIAYLKALYSSNLELALNLERGEIRSRMLKVLEGH